MTTGEITVRMGELASSRYDGDTLVSIGLGSCIGLGLIAADRGVAGLAHIMLPTAPAGKAGELGRYADTAVPALLEELRALGVGPGQLEAVLVGGARMFTFSGAGGLDIGARNQEATLAELETAGISVQATALGGGVGRTVWVDVGAGTVRCREAGREMQELYRSGVRA